MYVKIFGILIENIDIDYLIVKKLNIEIIVYFLNVL